MKFLLFIAVSFFFFAGFIQAGHAQRPIDRNGSLNVKGNQLVNKNGVSPDLRGISLSWSIWEGKKYYNPEVVDWLCKDFKISLLRVAMGVQPAGGYLVNKEEQMKLVTTVVDQAIKNGIYVLIDWHDHNADQHLKDSQEFFAKMAQKYSGVPNVMYEIFNEPARQTWPVVKSYALEVIRTIRNYDPKNIIVVGSPRWDQDVDVAALDPISGFENIVYSFHFYASDPGHQDNLRKKAELAMSRGVALIASEWGVGESNGNGVFDRQKTEVWMNWMETNHLSWATWHITDKKETTAILLPGAAVKGGWTTKELTESGSFIRKKLRKLN